MSEVYDESLNYFQNHKNEYLEDLCKFVRIPSISADSSYKKDIEKTALWLSDYLKSIGIEKIEIFNTSLFPIVFGEYSKAGPENPTMLIYGHYDVQPADPIDQWITDPFSPEIKNGQLFARGSSDMKGQLIVSLAAIDSILHTNLLPINIKFLLEGEEEIGSPNIVEFITNHKELLKSDFVLNLDAGMIAPDLPTITYGLRGLAYFELYVHGPEHDLHSGLFGGIVHNPALALCEILTGMKDKEDKILLPGFYDDVIPLSIDERQELARLPLDDDFYKSQTGVNLLVGEKGYSSTERVSARPTLDIHGIYSGYIGIGPKTVIPSYAMAKFSCRLVPRQEPARIYQQLIDYLNHNAPKTIQWEVKQLSSDTPCVINRNFPPTTRFSTSLEKIWNVKPVYKREGGSIPIVSYMSDILGIQSILSGFALPDDRAHSPNERLNLDLWEKGVKTVINFILSFTEAAN